jgi:hypothetical protein
MNELADYLPLFLFIAAFVFISARKGAKKQTEEEPETTPAPQTEQRQARKAPKREARPIIAQPPLQTLEETDENHFPQGKKRMEVEENIAPPLLNAKDLDEIKKAIVYSEIFNHKKF